MVGKHFSIGTVEGGFVKMNSRKEQFNRRAFLKFGSLAIGAGLVSRYLSSPTLASIVTAENLQRDYPVPGLVLYLTNGASFIN
jgi:hypothetical protein